MNPRFPRTLLLISGVMFFSTLFVIPILQLNSVRVDGDANTYESWTFVSLVAAAVSIFSLAVVPWLRARPLRKLRQSLQSKHPGALVIAVGVPPGEAVILLANGGGLGLVGSVTSLHLTPWAEVESINTESIDTWPNERIRVSMTSNDLDLLLVPLAQGGVQPIRKRQLEPIVQKLESLRAVQSTSSA